MQAIGEVCELLVERNERARARDEAAELSEDLVAFTRAAWPYYKPGSPYMHNWHIDAIAEHLVAVTSGQIRNLLITIPPRTIKSSMVSVMWPVWMWTRRPEYQFLCASYAEKLSIRDALASRRILQSIWFKQRWGRLFSLTSDQNAKTRYDNDASGYRIATSVDGTATGEGGDALIADDPHSLREIHSDVKRESVILWWDEVMPTRLNNPKTGVRIIVMQRGHENDLAGHVIRRGGYEHLSIPMEYELSKRKTVIGWSDPRKKKGELLWPARIGEKEVAALKVDLGRYGTASQLQQRPAPEEGGIFRKQDFVLWPHDVKLPVFRYVVQSYDTAFTEKTVNDAAACVVFGLFAHPKKKYNCVMVLDAWGERLEYPQLRRKVKLDFKAIYGEKDTASRVDIVLVEEKGSGITLLQDLRMLGVPASGYNPGKADKITRAHAATPFVEAGRVYLMESGKTRGQPVSWTDELMSQLMSFPNALHDDSVDAFTQALIFLRDREMLEAAVGTIDEDVPIPVREPAGNPYAQ